MSRRTWRAPVTAVFCLGIVAGLVLAVCLQRQPQAPQGGTVVPTTGHQVGCDSTPGGQGYIYSQAAADTPTCTNGATPRVLR